MLSAVLRYPKRLEDLWAGDGAAAVHSVYRNTVNLRWKGGLFALQPREVPGTPVSLTLGLDGDQFAALRPSVGAPVRLEPRGLYLEGRFFDRAGAEIWDPALAPWPERSDLSCLQTAVGETVAGLLGRGGLMGAALGLSSGEPPAGAVPRLAEEKLSAARAFMAQGDYAAAARAAADLVGLGEGLTPSGDDFCVGLLAALRIRAGPAARALRLCLEGAAARKLSSTNDISAQFLRCAIEGDFSQPVLSLLGGPLNPADCRAAARQLGAVGHSSGLDTLNGIYFGVSLSLLSES